jgi:hypothetical protein
VERTRTSAADGRVANNRRKLRAGTASSSVVVRFLPLFSAQRARLCFCCCCLLQLFPLESETLRKAEIFHFVTFSRVYFEEGLRICLADIYILLRELDFFLIWCAFE